MKTTLILTLLGALVGITVASFLVPPALSWYAEPGGLPYGASIQAVVQIPAVIRYATTKLIQWQAVSAGIGAVAGFALGIGVAIRSRNRLAPVTNG